MGSTLRVARGELVAVPYIKELTLLAILKTERRRTIWNYFLILQRNIFLFLLTLFLHISKVLLLKRKKVLVRQLILLKELPATSPIRMLLSN